VGEGKVTAITEGRMLGRRGRGRKIRVLDGMKRGKTYSEIKREIRVAKVGLSP
jgi:hypothetical protein